jgi:hypothetical protein
MSIDTDTERYQAMATEEQTPPRPDGSIQVFDRAMLVGIYDQDTALPGGISNIQNMSLKLSISIT